MTPETMQRPRIRWWRVVVLATVALASGGGSYVAFKADGDAQRAVEDRTEPAAVTIDSGPGLGDLRTVFTAPPAEEPSSGEADATTVTGAPAASSGGTRSRSAGTVSGGSSTSRSSETSGSGNFNFEQGERSPGGSSGEPRRGRDRSGGGGSSGGGSGGGGSDGSQICDMPAMPNC